MMRESPKITLLAATTVLLAIAESFAITRQLPQAKNGLTAILEGEIRLFKRAL